MTKQSVPLTLLARTARSLKRPSIASSSATANKATGPTTCCSNVEKATSSKSFNSSSRVDQYEHAAQQQSYASVVGTGSSTGSVAASVSSTAALEWPLSSASAPASSTSAGIAAAASLHSRPSWNNASTLPPSIAFLPSFWTSSALEASTSTTSSSPHTSVPAHFSTPIGTSNIHAPHQAGPLGKLVVPGSASSGPPRAVSSSSVNAEGAHTAVRHAGELNHPFTRHAQLDQSHLILQSGAYGIPKRAAKRSADPKGKGKAVQPEDGTEDPLQAQIHDLQTALLSVQVGEDAYFVRHNSLGVADGVGGWAGKKGADPGLFAARLMHHCSVELGQFEETEANMGSPQLSFIASSSANSSKTSLSSASDATDALKRVGSEASVKASMPHLHGGYSGTAVMQGDPIEVLHRAWDNTLTEFYDLELIGSTTALIAILRNDELKLANLGDCCCSIIRGQDYIFRSQEQQHAFNYPFQVGTNSQDTPRKDGQRFTIKVQRDDVVILSSDGLVDNLFDEDILEEVLRHGSNPQLLSQALCSRAKAVSEDQRAVASPFQQRANEEGIHFVGGKHDDISVLVAVIGDSEQQAAGM